MPLASDRVVKTGRPSIAHGVMKLLTVATFVYFAISKPASVQESIIIGSGLPAIEVNEEAAYYDPNQTRNLTRRLPLFDPSKHVLKSRILTLPLPGSTSLKATNQPERLSNQKPVEKSPVMEENVKEIDVTASAQNQTIPEIEEYEPQNIPSQEDPLENQTDVDSASPKSPETELAAIPPTQPATLEKAIPDATAGNSSDASTIIFEEGKKEMQEGQLDKLNVLVDSMLRDENIRLQLKSYASDVNGSPSGARRLSLARALAVRSFLIEAGVNSTRIDVRALGAKNESGPADRVDLVVAN